MLSCFRLAVLSFSFVIFLITNCYAFNKAPYPEFDFGGNGGSISNQKHNPSISNSGINNRTNARVTFPKYKVSTPFSTTSTWGRNALNKAVRGTLKFGKLTVAGVVVAYGIEKFIDEMGWFVEDDVIKHWDDVESYPNGNYYFIRDGKNARTYATAEQACIAYFESSFAGITRNHCRYSTPNGAMGTSPFYTCNPNYHPSGRPDICKPVTERVKLPVTHPMIDTADYTKYKPHPTDLPYVIPRIGQPDKVIIDPIPTIPGRTETETKPDGTVTETQREYTFDTRVDTQRRVITFSPTEKTTETDYKDGVKTDERVTTKTETPAPSESEVEEAIKEKTQPKAEPVPTDCDFMPTVCAFIDWVKSKPEDSEPDLKALKPTEAISQEKKIDIRFGSKTCPPPEVFKLSFIGGQQFELSYQPLCDIATKLYYLIIAFAYIYSAKILIGVIRG